MTERELLVDCLRRLNETGIDYMLTGSMVSNYWGMPRTTHDIDFVVSLNLSDARPLAQAFGGEFYIDETSIRAALAPPYQFNAIDTRSSMKVDFWLLHGNAFEQEMFKRRVRTALFGTAAWICTAEDVILHKLYWNSITPSERQLGDAAGVFAVQSGVLDAAYMKEWAARLGVSATLTDLLEGRIRPKQT